MGFFRNFASFQQNLSNLTIIVFCDVDEKRGKGTVEQFSSCRPGCSSDVHMHFHSVHTPCQPARTAEGNNLES